jgi:hypothetical protein
MVARFGCSLDKMYTKLSYQRKRLPFSFVVCFLRFIRLQSEFMRFYGWSLLATIRHHLLPCSMSPFKGGNQALPSRPSLRIRASISRRTELEHQRCFYNTQSTHRARRFHGHRYDEYIKYNAPATLNGPSFRTLKEQTPRRIIRNKRNRKGNVWTTRL